VPNDFDTGSHKKLYTSVNSLTPLQLSSVAPTFACVDVDRGPETVSAARGADGVDAAIKPVASNTLERDAAVIQRRRQ